MSNMSYCRFHNTYLDMNDCVNTVGEALDNGLNLVEFDKELSEDERYYFRRLVTRAHDLIQYYDELRLVGFEREKEIES